ncbi:response regulator [Sphingomonas xinjiangensis]|uniref:FixJ family two-component response regulator n=1 Tax=Sphingomonas xinjiangensis TaxID=643568 RepID=A0A840YS61_9SPHN|nr:FixJ family two-component response regulator [Sphingomonas xinjiangensis]
MQEGQSVCIIDDDAGVRRSLSGLLRSFGCEVSAFSSAEDFLQSDAVGRCQCLVSDFQIPKGMSGIDLARRLASHSEGFPMILITAYLTPEVEAEAKSAGVHCILAKPFKGEELIACIEGALVRAED